MGSKTFGNTSTPATGNNNSSQYNETASSTLFTVPEPARIDAMQAFISGFGAAVATKLCIWDASGNLLASTNQVSVAQGNGTLGGDAWQRLTFASPVFLDVGTQVYIGWWTDSNGGVSWGTYNSGTFKSVSNAASAGSIAGATVIGSPYFNRDVGIYCEYDPAGSYDYDGAAYQASTIYANDGSNAGAAGCQQATAYIFDGSAWQLAS